MRKADYWYSQLLYGNIISLNPIKKSNKNVLLSYITQPFRISLDDPAFYSHTNTWECLQIAKTWLNYGFNVDIIDWNNDRFIPKKDYEIFIDIHSNMERLAPLIREDCMKILHITGAHWLFQNNAEYSRLLSLQKRRKITLVPRRTVQPSRGIEYADCATILGNEFTQETFAFSGKTLYPIALSTTVQFPFFENKEFDKIRKNFLWFGGPGMVHKGLDLVLDAFSELHEYHLTVCGPVKDEPDFEKAYNKELYHTANIQTLGKVDVRSPLFLKICKENIALIYPSCSEGGGGSVITCLHAGMIPIISYESSVNINDFGIILRNCSIDEIIESIKQISRKPKQELEQMSNISWHYARKTHTRDKFSESYDKFVKTIIRDCETT